MVGTPPAQPACAGGWRPRRRPLRLGRAACHGRRPRSRCASPGAAAFAAACRTGECAHIFCRGIEILIKKWWARLRHAATVVHHEMGRREGIGRTGASVQGCGCEPDATARLRLHTGACACRSERSAGCAWPAAPGRRDGGGGRTTGRGPGRPRESARRGPPLLPQAAVRTRARPRLPSRRAVQGSPHRADPPRPGAF